LPEFRAIAVKPEIYRLVELLAKAEDRSLANTVAQAVKFYAIRKRKKVWLAWLEETYKTSSAATVNATP
jgi:hypothetical protein